jgi:hypothetical protein
MSVKYSRWPWNIFTFSNLRPSKIYPHWDFSFENKPSGNPGMYVHTMTQVMTLFIAFPPLTSFVGLVTYMAFSKAACWPFLNGCDTTYIRRICFSMSRADIEIFDKYFLNVLICDYFLLGFKYFSSSLWLEYVHTRSILKLYFT